MAATTTTVWSPSYLKAQLATALLNPVRAFRPRYLPLLMVYFAYGALGLISVAESFWVKKALTLSPAELAELSVWLTLPWTVKMVFGELVDAVPILGSQRRAYVFIGAAFIASGMLLLAGAAGGWLMFASLENLYRLGAFLTVLGVVIQDVAADAMSTEVVDRENPDGTRATRRRSTASSAWCRCWGGWRCRSAPSSSPASLGGSRASTAMRRCSSWG